MYQTQSNSSFSMLFSVPNNGYRGYEEDEMYSFTTSPSSASVDCTLSLGTPSTRGSNNHDNNNENKKRSSYMSSFGWNILPSKQTPPPSKGHRSGGDTLLARRCANCDTTSTPLWRNGPRGPKSLCNACGIRYKKEERRAIAAAANGNTGPAHMDTAQHMMSGPWAQAQKTACYSSAYENEYRFTEFNVADRPGLVHDFTR
ncbi:hypothetical protein CASFOL_015431 [Castilleja foliolosa]|uniref:GATA-type domain-containing protein n=1 Tax=Castilleja foliolosa TaxID=1961234 RepID=A0ABD3DE18_9LAMI